VWECKQLAHWVAFSSERVHCVFFAISGVQYTLNSYLYDYLYITNKMFGYGGTIFRAFKTFMRFKFGAPFPVQMRGVTSELKAKGVIKKCQKQGVIKGQAVSKKSQKLNVKRSTAITKTQRTTAATTKSTTRAKKFSATAQGNPFAEDEEGKINFL
jgi:hypothetical protein